MQNVQGRDAVEWDCPKCDSPQFTSMVPVELTDEDLDQQPELDGCTWCTSPETVKCKGCNTRYKLQWGE